ncbi:AraC family transcriptional regulator [Nocardia harenae]|uniref:AraC family transcriptional regulator n=1 Tax=Nocardia harenae TaxID=358707 RepID=UPI000833DF3C|nr:AraC family transcriptional regulator [Nocardia harenae]
MRNLTFDSTNLSETEEFLNRNYTSMQIGNVGRRAAETHVRRDLLGPVSLDRLHLAFDMAYDAAPLHKICLVSVYTGAVEENYHDVGPDTFLPGETGLLTPHDLPFSGVIRSARYDITMFDPARLDRVAARGGEPVRLTGHRPLDAAAGERLTAVIKHLQQIAAGPEFAADSLVAGTAADYLAATVLATMPTTALADPTATDRRDAHPDTVRRAIAYLETHLREDIALADVAAAAFVTPRALQLAFRKHLDTTPLQYLQRLRLHAVHEQLITAGPGTGRTVAAIAREWGFAHAGRFALAYRKLYGRSPSATLRG